VWGKGGSRGCGKGAAGRALWGGKGALLRALWGAGPRSFRADEEAVGGEFAAAVSWNDGEVAGGGEVREELLDAAAAEAGASLEGGLVDGPLAAVVGVVGDGDEDHEVRAAPGGVIEDGGRVLGAHWLPPPSPAAGREARPAAETGCGGFRRRRVRRRW